MRAISFLRATAAVVTAPVIAWSLHLSIIEALKVLQLRYPDWLFFMTSFYGYVFIGFVFAGVAAKLAPARNQSFINMTITGSVLTGLILAVTSDYAAAAEVTTAIAIVIGTVGYGLRLRGFSEPVHAG